MLGALYLIRQAHISVIRKKALLKLTKPRLPTGFRDSKMRFKFRWSETSILSYLCDAINEVEVSDRRCNKFNSSFVLNVTSVMLKMGLC